MLDRDGYRPNVGIIVVNQKNQVFWGKRIRTHSWQFPQGGIDRGENPEQAMFRELYEELGLKPEFVRVLGRTRDWLRYEVPERYIRRDARGFYKGQKQIWFLLQLTGHDWDLNLRATDHPEFDAWRWNDYWVPLESVVEFKRGVYHLALSELMRFLPRLDSWHPNDDGEHGARPRGIGANPVMRAPPGYGLGLGYGSNVVNAPRHNDAGRRNFNMELPPGASFDPDPHTNEAADAVPSHPPALAPAFSVPDDLNHRHGHDDNESTDTVLRRRHATPGDDLGQTHDHD